MFRHLAGAVPRSPPLLERWPGCAARRRLSSHEAAYGTRCMHGDGGCRDAGSMFGALRWGLPHRLPALRGATFRAHDPGQAGVRQARMDALRLGVRLALRLRCIFSADNSTGVGIDLAEVSYGDVCSEMIPARLSVSRQARGESQGWRSRANEL